MNRFIINVASLVLLLAITGHTSASKPTVTEFTLASWVLSDSQTPPTLFDSDLVKLPHYWDLPGLYGSAWYQLELSTHNDNQHDTWSVLLPKLIMNAQVWVNGHLIGTGGSFEPPIARYWHTPLMFNFPAILLKQKNTIHIRVKAYTNQHAQLGRVLIGPESDIKPLYSAQYFKSVTLSAVSGIFNALVAVFIFFIWFKRRESDYFWFAMSSLMWSMYSVNMFVVNIPIREAYWEKLVFLSSGWLAISIAFLLVRLDKQSYPKIEKYLLITCGLLSIIVMLIPTQFMFIGFSLWIQFSFIIGCSGVGHFALKWWLHKERQAGFILLMLLGIASAGLHDVLVQSGWLNQRGVLLLDYSLPLFFLIMSFLFASRFLNALEDKELLNFELESRVHAAGVLLEKNYREILFMEKQQATTQERERIHRDLHDSIGAKILSLVYRSTNDSDAALARSALSDLRNLVHEAPASEQSLLESIFEWEASCVERCLEGGKVAHFRVYNVPKTISLPKSHIYNLNALLSEALTNSLKHSNSKAIDISIRYRLGFLKFDLVESGRFNINEQWKEGFGMQNMRYRVNQLNGKIIWLQSANINRVSWTFPIKGNSNEKG